MLYLAEPVDVPMVKLAVVFPIAMVWLRTEVEGSAALVPTLVCMALTEAPEMSVSF